MTKAKRSDTTKEAILAAARERFAEDGYERATIRAIAADADIDPSMVMRYFGNKEKLFAEAVRGQALELLADGPPAELLDRTLTAMLDPEPARAAEPFLAVLKGAGSAGINEEVRAELGEAYTTAFAALVDTADRADAALRAELLLAWLLGIALMRSMPRPGPAPDSDAVRAHVRRAAAALLGPPPP